MLLTNTLLLFFFFNDTATTEIYTLSLHDALPISCVIWRPGVVCGAGATGAATSGDRATHGGVHLEEEAGSRSEEHTSELQSQSNLVCRLLLEKKKKKITTNYMHIFT